MCASNSNNADNIDYGVEYDECPECGEQLSDCPCVFSEEAGS